MYGGLIAKIYIRLYVNKHWHRGYGRLIINVHKKFPFHTHQTTNKKEIYSMIAAVFLRHYKVYQGATFIPIIEDKYPMTLFIGDNAIGKSSILEALNVYFNDEKWNLTRSAKKSEAFISPLFLIEKQMVNQELIKEMHSKMNSRESIKEFSVKLLKSLEDGDIFYRSIRSENMKQYTGKSYRELINYIENKCKDSSYDNYYLFMTSSWLEPNEDFQILGETNGEQHEKALTKEQVNFLMLFSKVYYTYVYFPVEENANDVLKLDSLNLQKLMNKNVLSTIEDLIKSSKYNGQGKDKGSGTLTEHLNVTLEDFLKDINIILKEKNDEYEFTHKENSARKITEKHLIDIIVQRFLSVRSLKNNKKDISMLSSGEQRQSIINISLAFLKNSNNDKLGKVIIAIDEPELSLHMSKLYNQFELVSEISHYSQLLVTTHWYGYLPVLDKGSTQFLEKQQDEIKIHSSMSNDFYGKRKNHIKDDIYLKSFFDLSVSIFSSLREGTNWIVCEGLTDKKYIQSYYNLINSETKLKVLAVGGISEVLRLYKHLYFPISDQTINGDNGNIIFLTDTDTSIPNLEIPDHIKNSGTNIGPVFSIYRLCNGSERKIIQYNNTSRHKTDIENCLDPLLLFNALVKSMQEIDDSTLKILADKLKFNDAVEHGDSYSFQIGELLFKTDSLDSSDIKNMKSIFNNPEIKVSTAINYTESINSDTIIPVVFESIFNKVGVHILDSIADKPNETIASGTITLMNESSVNKGEEDEVFKDEIDKFINSMNNYGFVMHETLKMPRARKKNIYSMDGNHIDGTKFKKFVEKDVNGKTFYFNLDLNKQEKKKVISYLNDTAEKL